MSRIARDFYPTEAWITDALIESYGRQHIKGNILECAAGQRHMSDRLKPLGNVFTTDIAWDSKDDATTARYWNDWHVDWVVTNPPFGVASEILSHAWDTANVGVAMLLRLTFAEPTNNRHDLLHQLSDHQVLYMPIGPRPSFRSDKKGGDSVTVAWFVWRKDFSWSANGMSSPFSFYRRDKQSRVLEVAA